VQHGLVRLLPILLALALASSACSPGASSEAEPAAQSDTGPASRSAGVIELRSASELRQRFNDDSGKVRLILLISPT
jgi:hypothetical protein